MYRTADSNGATNVLVWFEDGEHGRAALERAEGIARAARAHLTVLTVATHEQLIGCGRCIQGTALWNIEMDKIALEDLATARRILVSAGDTSYERAVGNPLGAITEVAERVRADIVVLPLLKRRRFEPPNRRDIREKVERGGPWRVVVDDDPVPA